MCGFVTSRNGHFDYLQWCSILHPQLFGKFTEIKPKIVLFDYLTRRYQNVRYLWSLLYVHNSHYITYILYNNIELYNVIILNNVSVIHTY